MRSPSRAVPALLVCAALTLVSCGPVSHPRAPIVFTTWVKDPSVVYGPYPGYRPHFTGIDRRRITLVTYSLDPVVGTTDYVVNYSLDDEGTRLFASITKQAATACAAGPGSCPESHITIWLGLNQDDVDNWNDRAAQLYQFIDLGGKVVADPYIAKPITSGEGYIAGDFSNHEAAYLVRRMKG